MKEIIKEVYISISRHKIRSLLTGFGIAWGMFILIILLGAGNGFRAGTMNVLGGYASNSLWTTGYWTSEAMPGGIQSGTRITFSDDILKKLRARFPEIKLISPEIPFGDWIPIFYNDKMSRFNVKGIGKDYLQIKLLEVEKGKLFNKFDYQEQRRSVIIGKRVQELLFENETPIGKCINISGVLFQIVGILKEGTIYSSMEQNNIYVPDATLYSTFNTKKEYFTFGILLQPNTPTDTFEYSLRSYLGKNIGFDGNDKGALYINNIQLQVKAFNSLFDGLNLFLWALGLCFLLSGMIGITNIMLVVVKERTEEIGIRKAIGATPNSIIQLIISEAFIITFLFGIVGILLGYGGISVYNWVITALQGEEHSVFAKATINGNIVYAAFVLLILSGITAGIFPAQRASRIMPIETLNRSN